MKYFPGWSSHYPVLVKVLKEASRCRGVTFEQDNGVLELGMGPFSTPLLHWLCFDLNLKLTSYDNDPKYSELNRHFETEDHQIIQLEDWNTADIDKKWLVAFVDHKPASRRRDEIARLTNNALFVIVHDTEPESNKWYRYDKVFGAYKYCYNYTKASPNTTVLSNFIDLSFLG